MSWDEQFSQRYEEWSAQMAADVPFYVALAAETQGAAVELAVGDGRVAIPIARATRGRVIGIDSSPMMIERARSKAAEAGVDSTCGWRTCATSSLRNRSASSTAPSGALLHLPTWADRRNVFERVAAGLRLGGKFAWNAFAFDHHVAAGFDGSRRDTPVPHVLRYDVPDNRIDILLDEGGSSSLWWATKNEWLGLIDVAGLELEALYGDFDRSPLTRDSREYVFVATRR